MVIKIETVDGEVKAFDVDEVKKLVTLADVNKEIECCNINISNYQGTLVYWQGIKKQMEDAGITE